MGDSFIPTKDADALAWMQTFSATAAANPATYQFSGVDVTTIASAVNAFADANAVAVAPATRTPVSIGAKSLARGSAEALLRRYCLLIKFNSGISDLDKIAIGVRPVNPSREPITVPQSTPLLNIIAGTPGAQTLRYCDSNTPDTGKKPFGALQIQIFVVVATGPTANENAARFYGAFTRNPIGVAFDEADNGKTATYFARWAGRRGDTGPFSLPVSMTIAA